MLDTYEGRKIPRQDRLKQMRESQKRLRQKRNNEVEELRQENALLKKQIVALSRNDQSLLASSPINLESVYALEVTSEINCHIKGRPTAIDSIPVFGFVTTYDKESLRLLFFDETECFFSGFTTRSLERIEASASSGKDLALMDTFRLSPLYGQELIDQYLLELKQFAENSMFPVKWGGVNGNLPKGTLTVVGMVKYILDYVDLTQTNLAALTESLSRRAFATLWGPAVTVSDLNLCVEESFDVKKDITFLIND